MSVYDVRMGKELARLPTKRKIVHGVIVSPDDRYAFVSVEGVGSEPGTVEVIDLTALKTVATIDVGQEAAGIDFYRIESAAEVDPKALADGQARTHFPYIISHFSFVHLEVQHQARRAVKLKTSFRTWCFDYFVRRMTASDWQKLTARAAVTQSY